MNDTPEPTEQDKALACKWGKILDKALKRQREDKQESRFKKLRAYVRGDVGDDGEKGLVRTNIIHSNFAAILPQIYAKNPEIAVTPIETSGEVVPWVPAFCKTLQSVINRCFVEEGKLKKRAKSSIRSAMTTSIGWTKLSWQEDIRTDPIIENRISDTQDNLQRIQFLLSEIADGDDGKDELEAKQAEVQLQLEALQQKAEVISVSGLVIDRVLTEDIFILDDTIYDFDQYEQAEALAHRVWMTCEQYEQTFGKEPPKTANKFGSDKKEQGRSKERDDDWLLVAVFEIWNKTSNTVYTLCSGAEEWARDPYVPKAIGRRFYPFFALAFNPVDGRVMPLSDAELLIELQDEYSRTRTNFAEHRAENIPVRVYRKSGDLTDRDIKALTNRTANQWVGIEGNPDNPVEKDIAILPNPQIDPAAYDVQPILRDAEMVLGAGDAAKGVINKAKTATEAEIMDKGLQSRVSERQDVVEDYIGEMAQYAAEILLQELTPQQVQRIAGQESVWPQMDKEQIFDLVEVQIRAGSSGRPNKAKEREQWAQMLPQIQQSMTQIMQLRQAGQNDMAESMMKLMEETLRRFDERIDIESFLPQSRENGQQQQIPPELQQKMQELQAENEQLKQLVQGKEQESKNNQAKLGTDLVKAREEIASKAELERERIASQERVAMAKTMVSMCQQGANDACMTGDSMPGESKQSSGEQGGNQQVMVLMQQMQDAMKAMAQHFSNSMTAMHESMNAPKRVVKDNNGDIIGVEVVRTLQ